jgi:hypothetical protein
VAARPAVIIVEPSENRRTFYARALNAAGYYAETASSLEAAFGLGAAAGTFLIVRLSALGHSVETAVGRSVVAGLRPIVLIPDYPYTRFDELLQWYGVTAVVVGTWNIEGAISSIASLRLTCS